MKQKQQTYQRRHILSSLFMLLALAWLTVCLPYVNESQQRFSQEVEQGCDTTPEPETDNPLTTSNEEKAESKTSLFSEYLHSSQSMEHSFVELALSRKCCPSDEYLAYHPDLIILPPEA